MPKEDFLELEGGVEEALSNGMFRITCDNGLKVLGHLAGKMRINNIRILPGDRVRVHVSPYDLTKARIIFRGKYKNA